MKRLFIAVLAMASLVACNKNEVLETVSPDAITFEGAWVDNATRSEDPSYTNEINDKFELKEFDVYGFMTSFTGVVFDQELVSKSVVNGEAKWSYANLQYWTPGKQYWFAALAPAGGYSLEKPTTDEAAKYGVGKVTFVQPNVIAEVGTVDLIYSAVQEDGPASVAVAKEPVKLQFKHLLSKVKFSFKNGFTNENATVKITNITMKVPAKGSIDLAQQDWWTTNEWELVAGNPTTMEFGDMEVEKLEIGKTTSSEYERLTFPTDPDHEYVVEFDAELFYGAESAYTSHLTTTITGAELKIGKAYNFVAEINNENIVPGNDKLNPIEFTVEEIKEWGNDVVYDGGAIVTGPFVVNNATQLAAAIAQINDPNNNVKAAEIKLNHDIDLGNVVKSETAAPSFIEVKTNLTFNLNGKTIRGGWYTQDGDQYSYVFRVKEGGYLTIVGDGNVISNSNSDATDNIDDYSIAVRADDGGKVDIKGGTFQNFGEGSELIYATTNAVINIYGGTFKPMKKGEGVESTNDAYLALNLKDDTNAEIHVFGGQFYNFNPAENLSENPAKNYVEDGYMVIPSKDGNDDVYTVVPQKFEVGNEAELFAAVTAAKAAENPTITLTNNVTVSTTVNVDCKLNLNLNGYTLTNKLANENTDVIVVTSTGDLTVYGEGTVEAVTGNDGYAIISEGTLTINEGTYKSGIDAAGETNAVIYARGNGKVYVNGGNFPNDNASKFVLNKKDADRANTVIEVKGGSYGLFNPANNAAEGANTSFLAAGYNVVKTGDAENPVYTVLAPSCTLAEDAAAVTMFKVTGTLNGANKTLSIDEVNRGQFLVSSTLRLIEAKAGSTIKNLYIDGKDSKFDTYGIRAIFMVGAGHFALDNVHIKNVTYALNDDSAEKTLSVNNSTLEGWTSYNKVTKGTFTSVDFTVNEKAYGTFRPHGETILTDCDFAEGYTIMFDFIITNNVKISFNGCRYNNKEIKTVADVVALWPEAANIPAGNITVSTSNTTTEE